METENKRSENLEKTVQVAPEAPKEESVNTSGGSPSSKKKAKNNKSIPTQKEGKHNSKKRPPQKRKVKSTKRLFVGLLIKIGVIALAIWATLTFVLGVTIHYGNNMHPAIRDGDLVVTFRLDKPFINAVVMYKHNGETMIGRVVALEDSVIDIDENGNFKINDSVPAEEVFYPTYPDNSSDVKYPYTVEKGKAFILNDFREDTHDSRSFGAVPIDDIKGPLLFTMRRRGF